MNKLFIGNLSYKAEDSHLQKLFGAFGELVEAKIVMDKADGRSRGFGFVTFKDPAAAQKAVNELDGQDLLGRALRVSFAKEKASS